MRQIAAKVEVANLLKGLIWSGCAGFAHSMLNAIRKTLSASSVSYLETLQETETK